MPFKKGQSGNPKGRKSKPTEEKYLRLLREAVSDDDWKDAIKAMLRQAKCGDVAAFKAIAEYLTPKPAQKLEVAGEGGGPVKLKVVYQDRAKHGDA
jgi:uncharacterized protein DUF5681